eukprot:92337-Pleurochrysis_carterae.AAC.1
MPEYRMPPNLHPFARASRKENQRQRQHQHQHQHQRQHQRQHQHQHQHQHPPHCAANRRPVEYACVASAFVGRSRRPARSTEQRRLPLPLQRKPSRALQPSPRP